jgi:hypothetical protein
VDYGQGFAIGRPAPLSELLPELPLYASADPMASVLSDIELDHLIEIVH